LPSPMLLGEFWLLWWCIGARNLLYALVIEVFLVGCLVGTSARQGWRAVQLRRRRILHACGLFCSYVLWRLWNVTRVGGLMSLACSLLCDFYWNVEPQKRGSRIQFTPFAASSWTGRLQCHSGYTLFSAAKCVCNKRS
jgi:hypothetical protein